MLNEELKSRLLSAKSALAGAGVAHIAVFGSRARGQENAGSDLDVLIEAKPDAKFSLLDLVGAEQTLSEATGLRTNAVMRRSLDAEFRARIEPDIIEIF